MEGMRTVNHPKELHWRNEPIPPVESVPDCTWILCWVGKDGRLGNVLKIHPWGNELNPRRWCESGGMPLGAWTQDGWKVEWWAYLRHPERIAD